MAISITCICERLFVVINHILKELESVLNKQDEEIEAENNADDRSLPTAKPAKCVIPRTQSADVETGKQHKTYQQHNWISHQSKHRLVKSRLLQ